MEDYTALIREARSSGHYKAGTIPLTMTPALFGKLLIAAWAERAGRSDFPRRDRVMNVLLASATSAPEEIRSIMHVESRLSGDVIAEYGEYLAAAQMDGLIKRYNPDYVRVAVEIDERTGREIVDGIVRRRDDFRDWISTVADRLVKMQQGAVMNVEDERATVS